MARSQPVISVAMATHNYGRYLPRALDSVFRCHNPTAAPIQVVVADDASTDNTRAVLADYRQRYPQQLEIVSICSPAGVGAAKNAALDRCVGSFVALLDADDEFLPEKLSYGYDALQRTGVDFVTNDFFHQYVGGERVLCNRDNWTEWFWPPSTWIFRRGLVRFNAHRLGGDDPEWLERRWSSVQHRHLHLDLPLSVQHLHGGNSHRHSRTRVPGLQAAGRWMGKPHPDDLLAPEGWSCRECGNQYLLPATCCGRETVAGPLYFYMTALSPHTPAQVEFSLVMLTRNRLSLTRRAVSSLLASLPPNRSHTVELIFVNGCSSDGTLDYIRHLARHFPVKLLLTHPAEPFQYARACNRGARAAVGRFLLLLNNDIELRSADPWEPLRTALSDPHVGVVGTSTVWVPGQRDPDWPTGPPLYRYVDRPVTGPFWGARRDVYWELGGQDEALTGYGYEELDFQFTAQKAQYRLALAHVSVRHEVQATFGPIYGPTRLQALAARNRVLFEQKHGRRVYTDGSRMEPYASQGWAEQSVVIAVSREAAALRETLAQAAADEGCRAGRVQVVVVAEGSEDETARVLEEYRGRLAQSLTVVRVEEGVGRARAQESGRERAIGQSIHVLAPGDWLPTTTTLSEETPQIG